MVGQAVAALRGIVRRRPIGEAHLAGHRVVAVLGRLLRRVEERGGAWSVRSVLIRRLKPWTLRRRKLGLGRNYYLQERVGIQDVAKAKNNRNLPDSFQAGWVRCGQVVPQMERVQTQVLSTERR